MRLRVYGSGFGASPTAAKSTGSSMSSLQAVSFRMSFGQAEAMRFCVTSSSSSGTPSVKPMWLIVPSRSTARAYHSDSTASMFSGVHSNGSPYGDCMPFSAQLGFPKETPPQVRFIHSTASPLPYSCSGSPKLRVIRLNSSL